MEGVKMILGFLVAGLLAAWSAVGAAFIAWAWITLMEKDEKDLKYPVIMCLAWVAVSVVLAAVLL
jgi:hypothetical protein